MNPESNLAEQPIFLPGGRLHLPADWLVATDVAPYLVFAVEPVEDLFAANLNVVRETTAPAASGATNLPEFLSHLRELDPDRYLAGLAQELEGFHLIDLEAMDLAESPGLHLLGLHHTLGRGLAVEQWIRPDADGVTILSTTTLAWERDLHADTLAAVAASWVPGGG